VIVESRGKDSPSTPEISELKLMFAAWTSPIAWAGALTFASATVSVATNPSAPAAAHQRSPRPPQTDSRVPSAYETLNAVAFALTAPNVGLSYPSG
jgi:hypothetical protein